MLEYLFGEEVKKFRQYGYGSNFETPKSVSTRDGGGDERVIGEVSTQGFVN